MVTCSLLVLYNNWWSCDSTSCSPVHVCEWENVIHLLSICTRTSPPFLDFMPKKSFSSFYLFLSIFPAVFHHSSSSWCPPPPSSPHFIFIPPVFLLLFLLSLSIFALFCSLSPSSALFVLLFHPPLFFLSVALHPDSLLHDPAPPPLCNFPRDDIIFSSISSHGNSVDSDDDDDVCDLLLWKPPSPAVFIQCKISINNKLVSVALWLCLWRVNEWMKENDVWMNNYTTEWMKGREK